MIIPQFSLRWLLALTALCAGVSLVLSFAFRQQPWAIGMAAALGSAVGLALLFVGTFLVAWLISRATAGIFGQRSTAGESPFKLTDDSPFEPVAPALPDAAVSDSPSPITG